VIQSVRSAPNHLISGVRSRSARFSAACAAHRVHGTNAVEFLAVDLHGHREIACPARCLEARLRLGQEELRAFAAPDRIEVIRAQRVEAAGKCCEGNSCSQTTRDGQHYHL
jgi:hypothetical protein